MRPEMEFQKSFNSEVCKKTINLTVYCDERIIGGEVHPKKENWIYIALLIIPDIRKLEIVTSLNDYRKERKINYPHELKFYNLRDKNGSNTKLAKLWLKSIINDVYRCYFFKVLGVKKDNLLFKLFGEGSTAYGKFAVIYGRFFKTALISALNSFFPKREYKKIIISKVVHHQQGYLQGYEYFSERLLSRIKDERISFENNEFVFIESDHNVVKEESVNDAHLVQLIDILVGAVSHCLDCCSEMKGKEEAAKVILPLVNDILNGRDERFNCFRKYDVQFFPSKSITSSEFNSKFGRMQEDFFRNRRILLEEHLFGRQSEFDFKSLS